MKLDPSCDMSKFRLGLVAISCNLVANYLQLVANSLQIWSALDWILGVSQFRIAANSIRSPVDFWLVCIHLSAQCGGHILSFANF